MSLDGKTGSNLVNLDGKSDSNSITLLSGINISVIENPTDTYTINAIASGAEYSNTDNNLVIDNVSDIINLSTTINVSNISADLITSKNVQIGSFASGNNAVFSHKNYFNNLSYAFAQSPTGITLINSATDKIWVLKNTEIRGDLNVSKNINASSINTSALHNTTIHSSTINVSSINSSSISTYSAHTSTIANYQINSYNTCSSNISAGNLTASYLAVVDLINVGDKSFSNISTLHNTTIYSSSCNISDLVVKGSVSLPAYSLVVSNISNLQNSLNSKQDNITLIGGTNVTVAKSANTWTINSQGSGGGGGNIYTNTDNYLVINNNDYTINLSSLIYATDISCGNLSAKNFSLVDDITSYRMFATHVSVSSISIPNDTIEKSKIINLNTSLDSLSKYIGSLNTSVSSLSNNKQDKITLKSGSGISISQLPTNTWTITNTNTNTGIGNNYTNTDNNISINNSSDIINLSTTLNISKINLYNVSTTTLSIPDGCLTINNISNLNSCLNSLSSNKQNNITLIGGTNVTISQSPADTWTINTGSTLKGSPNISVRNGSINLKNSIEANNASFKNLSIETIKIPNGSLSRKKVLHLTTNLSEINASITNLSTDVANLNTSVHFISNIASTVMFWGGYANSMAGVAKNWAQLDESPGGAGTKSSKSWSSEAQNWSNTAKGYKDNALVSAGAAAGSATAAGGAATLAGTYATNSFNSAAAAGGSATSANNNANSAAGYRDKAKDWAQSGLPPDPANTNSKSAKSWSSKSQSWAESNGNPGGGSTKSSKSWSSKSQDWAEKTTAPGGGSSRSSKSWSNVAKDWAEKTTAPGGGSTRSSKSWSNVAQDWAEKTTAPGGGSTRSAKSWAGFAQGYRDDAQDWAEKTTAPGGGSTRSSKSWSNVAKAWAESTTPPEGGSTRSAKKIVEDFQNSLPSLSTNNISVFNNSINISSNISIGNCSLLNLSADKITSGLGRITTNDNDLAAFGNKHQHLYPAITQSTGGVVTINSYQNFIYLRKHAANGTNKSLYFTGDNLVMDPVKIGGINGDAVFSNINCFDILNFALAQSNDGQTFLSSSTPSIKTLKGMDISGNLNVSNNINSSTITSNEGTITNLNSSTLVANSVKIGGISEDAVFSNINHFNIVDGALVQSDNGQTWLSSATSSIITLKGMDISGATNTSSINSSNASFDNLTIPDDALSKDKITGLNTSLDDLSITFEDPDGNNVNDNKKVIIPYDIQFLYPNQAEAVNESLGFKYVEIPYYIYFEDIRGSDAVYHETNIDKRTVIIPDVIDFVNINNQNIVNVTNNTRSVTVPEFVDFVDIYGTSVVQDVNGVNTVILTNAEPNPAIQSTFEVGSVRIGTLTGSSAACFGNNNLGNTDETYALRQNNDGGTSINSYNGKSVKIRNSGDNMATFYYVNEYNVFKLFPRPVTNGTCQIELHNQLGQSWAMQIDTNKLVFKFSDYQDKFFIRKNGDGVAVRNIEAGKARIGTNGSFDMASFGHKSFANNSEYYAFGQSSDGQALINTPTNNSISFRINNTEKMRLDSSGYFVYSPLSNYGNYACYGQINAQTNIVCGGAFYAPTVYIGTGILGDGFGMICKRNHENDSQKYSLLQDNDANTSINGRQRINFKIKNVLKLYMNDQAFFAQNGFAFDSDDRLKYDEQDISGLKTIRQLNPKKYIKIPVPFVKKRRRYYDENEITIVDKYIEDVSMNEINEINKSRKDISMNDLSFNEYYDDDDYIHKEIIEEEDVDEFVTEQDISNGRVEVGLIAQDLIETDISFVVIQQDIPEDMNGKPLFQPYAVDYGSVMPYCIQAIKDLDTIVQGLKDKINNLEAENDILEARVHELENV